LLIIPRLIYFLFSPFLWDIKAIITCLDSLMHSWFYYCFISS
jgi:hypothetical protein